MTDREQAFGEYLRGLREDRAIELFEVSRRTRIPVRSLKNLEAGDFDSLPADIFVRGFIRSYAHSVGLASGEATEVMDRYIELGRKPPSLSADVAAASRWGRAERKDATPFPAPAADPRSTTQRTRAILPVLSDSEKETEGRRGGSVTVAVIILVIVATLGLSYLLRKPSSDSDDFTRALPAQTSESRPS